MNGHVFKRLLFHLPPNLGGALYHGYLVVTGYTLKGYEQNRCIFVRIPKCGTRSLSNSLFGNKGGGHTDILSYRLIFGEKKFRNFFKFTFVRNPWDRTVSAYYFLKQGGLNKDDARWAQRHLTPYSDFRTFVTEWLNHESVETRIHFRPQYRFLCDESGELLVDFVGHYERIGHDFAHVKQRLNLDTDLVHSNRTASRFKDYRRHYDDHTAGIVARTYRHDIERFQYRFDGSTESGSTRGVPS